MGSVIKVWGPLERLLLSKESERRIILDFVGACEQGCEQRGVKSECEQRCEQRCEEKGCEQRCEYRSMAIDYNHLIMSS